MTATELITQLSVRGIELAADDGKLRFRPADKLTPKDLEHLRRFKPVLLRLLRSEAISCAPHNDPSNYTFGADRYNRPGWRAVTCRLCGTFIGYQPPQGE